MKLHHSVIAATIKAGGSVEVILAMCDAVDRINEMGKQSPQRRLRDELMELTWR